LLCSLLLLARPAQLWHLRAVRWSQLKWPSQTAPILRPPPPSRLAAAACGSG
jgi:hypothetical protein